MAAPMLSNVQVVKRTIRSKTTKKPPSYKNVLLDPHPVSWPVVDEEMEAEILQKMKSVFSTLKLGRPAPVKKPTPVTENKKDREQHKKEQKLKKKKEKEIQQENLKDEKNSSPLVMGLNNVVRCLERGQLRLVVICRNVNQSLFKMMNHLLPLCGSRGCPAVCLKGLQSEIAPILFLRSLMAIGIKTCDDIERDVLGDLVTYVTQRCPAIEVPCLDSSNTEISKEESNSSTEKPKNITKDVMDTDSHVIKKVTMETVSHSSSCNAGSNQKKLSKMTNFSDLYIYKDVLLKKFDNRSLDFIQFDADDNDDEVITFTLPKTSKTREVNPNKTLFTIPDDNDDEYFQRNIPETISTAVKRKFSGTKSEGKSSGWKKAKIKQKKPNPNKVKKIKEKKKGKVLV